MNKERYQHIFVMLREEINRPDSVEWFTWKQMKEDVDMLIANDKMSYVHENMQDFYIEYLWGIIKSNKAWHFIDIVAHNDDYFGQWATGKIDLVKLTEVWIERGDSRTLLSVLTRLGLTGYETNWHELRSLLDEKLRRMEVEGTRNGMKETGYFYCLLHAFTMIMMSEHSVEDKMRLLEQFSRQWAFLRTVYSVMVRRIVGLNYTNFAQLAQYVVGGQQDFDPFLHLFHAPLKERFEDLVEMGTKRESLAKAIRKIEQRMHDTQPSYELDSLCETLFPEEFCDMLNRHRPKSYQELECEIAHIRRDMHITIDALNGQIKELATRLSAAVEAAVPIQEIEEELMKFQSREAIAIYMQLNLLLVGNVAWQTRTLNIRDKILAKQQQEMQLSMNITAQPGSNVNGIVQQQMNNSILPNKQIASV